MSNKTPSYKIKSVIDYQKRHTRKHITLHSEHDKTLLEAIDKDPTPFATVAKIALRQYYKIEKP